MIINIPNLDWTIWGPVFQLVYYKKEN